MWALESARAAVSEFGQPTLLVFDQRCRSCTAHGGARVNLQRHVEAVSTVVAKKAGHALHILDRFHIAKHMSDAIDHVRRAEVDALRQQGRQPLLTKTRWLLLKRPANQTREQRTRLRELVQHNLRAVRAMLLRESFEPFWHDRSVGRGRSWTTGVSR